jgi:hypothetical protein
MQPSLTTQGRSTYDTEHGPYIEENRLTGEVRR